MTSYPPEFEEHVRQLLSDLYDYLKLVENPVARRLAGDQSGKARLQAIRQAVMAAIDELRGDSSRGPGARQNRLRTILTLRYIDERGTSEALVRLALSERQYYREHQRALQTISQLIWDRHFAAQADSAAHSLAQELSYLSQESLPASFDAYAEVEAALRATRVIAEQRGIRVRLIKPDSPIELNTAQPVLRQLIIYLLNSLMTGLQPGADLAISIEPAGAIAFSSSGELAAWQAPLNDATALALLRSLHARLELVQRPPGLRLSFEDAKRKILVVDDNPDSLSLFKRYLANLPYQLLSAQAESEALKIAQETPLLGVILDVMLPGKDGWQILQRFKSHPDTADIPVLICSVLDMRELALSLGADGYLKKPPPREELLAMLRAWQQPPVG